MTKQFATYTKYYGIESDNNPKAVKVKQDLERGLKQGLRKQIKHNGEKPADYITEVVYYQSYEDGNISCDNTPADIHGAVYFPEPIFPNSLPVVLVAALAYPKEETV